ncbi:MAG TPA: M48 family metallopeptidase [Beijerinckiaceae bacterium]|nr:M48 family metallopeptidase [Beijerinckiaceae bacterium]
MAGAFGLYSHIQANRRRSFLLIAGLFALIYALVFAGALAAAGLRGGPSLNWMLARAFDDLITHAPLATGLTLIWIVIAYLFHQKMIDAITDSHSVERKDEPKLYNQLENLCISRGVPMPQLKIMESEVLNAFASGLNEKQYCVTVTRGLMQTLNDEEMEAVLAHELTHIRNGDVKLMVTAVIIAGVVSFFAELLFRWLARGPTIRFSDDNGDSKKASPAAAALMIAVVIVVVAWVASGLLRFALSRTREYLADAGAAELTKNPDALISALLKISGRAEIPGAPSGLMEMCIENERSGFVDVFATHPPIEDRVEALVKFAGGHMPAPEAGPKPSFLPETVQLDSKLGPWGQAAAAANPWRR